MLSEALERVKKFVRMVEVEAKAVKDNDTHEVFLHNHERKLKELKRQVSELENLVQVCTEAVIQSGRGAGVSDRQTWEMMQGQ